MISATLKQQQDAILESIYASKDACAKNFVCTGVLDFVNNLNILDAEYGLGIIGEKLKLFTELIDLNHPDLAQLFDGQLISETEKTFSREALDLLKIALFIKQFGLSKDALTVLRSSIKQHPEYEKIYRAVNCPLENQLHVRFVRSGKMREVIRASKKSQEIDPTFLHVFERANNLWDNLPNDFSNFSRNQNMFVDELKQAKDRKKVFAEHGLTFMAKEIDKAIDEIEKQSQKQVYFGFNKLNLSFVALLLAKMHGFERYTTSSQRHTYTKSCEKFDFTNEKQSPIEVLLKVFPYHELQDRASNEIKSLINHLDNFPAIEGKPLFDHYRIVVSGYNYPTETALSFRSINGGLLEFTDKHEAQKTLISMLLTHGKLFGVLLGERDGEHYFISYFM
jgi:hypothetical protein